MRVTPVESKRIVCVLTLVVAAYAGGPPQALCAPADTLLYVPGPVILPLGEFTDYDELAVSDVALGDFDNDGRLDVAAAWFVTDTGDYLRNLRRLTIYFNEGASFVMGAEVDLYVPDMSQETLSIFYIGTASLGTGDYDGDGDLDLAVMPYFGDEIQVVENRGDRMFVSHVKYPYTWNSEGNPLTPPKVAAGDFDLNGRVELVYVCDPSAQYLGRMMHFWQATGGLPDIRRVDWLGGSGGVATWFVRGLAVADFDADNRPDLCYTGALNHDIETSPVLTFWYGFNGSTRRFSVSNAYPTMVCSDVVAVRPTPASPAGVVLGELDGTRIQYWTRSGAGMQFTMAQELTGYAGALSRGLAIATADVDGDGDLDLVTKLRQADASNAGQVEFTRWDQTTGQWAHATSLVDTTGFTAALPTTFLRPSNLAVGDLFGNTLPEVVAGFAGREVESAACAAPAHVLEIAIWANGCIGDVNRDGRTNGTDVSIVNAARGYCRGQPGFNADADIDKDGCVTEADKSLVTQTMGCDYSGPSALKAGDLNCDGLVDLGDINHFVIALHKPTRYEDEHPYCHLLNADCNYDAAVNFGDINAFIALLNLPRPSGNAGPNGSQVPAEVRMLLSVLETGRP